MIKGFSASQRNILIACGVIFCFYIFYLMVMRPFQEKLDSIDERILLKEEQLKKNLSVIGQAGALDQKYKGFLSQFKQTDTNEQVMSSILSEIDAVAGSLQMHILDLKPQSVVKNGYNNQFPVNLTIESEFANIVQFIYLLQSPPHFFDVEEVHFEKNFNVNSASIKTSLILSKTLMP